MTLSVIVATHDRPDDLRRCLAALARQSVPVEVVVADSASTPPVGELSAALKVVRCGEPGVSLARNTGAHEASGDLLAFLDDDTTPYPDWAERMVAAFAESGASVVGGACLPVFDGDRPAWLSDRLLQISGITNFEPQPRYVTRTRDFPFSANLGVRRDAFEAAGGFDVELGRLGSGEDMALVGGIAAAGGRVWVDPGVRVDHRVQRERLESRWYWRRFWRAGVARAHMPGRARTAVRLLLAFPIRLIAFAATRDRIYLYRAAELAGFFRELLSRQESADSSRSA